MAKHASHTVTFVVPAPETHRFRRKVHEFTPLSNAAAVLLVEAITSTSIRITWAAPVLNNAPLRAVSTYEIVVGVGETPVEVLAVTPSGSPAESVLLTTTEMRDDLDYEMLVHFLERS